MNRSYSRLTAACFLSVLLLLHGCSSMHPIEHANDPDKLSEKIGPGAEIRVKTKNGQQIELTVKTITKEKIIGEGNVEVLVTDVTEVEVKRFSTGKTVGLYVLISIIAAGIALKAAFD